MQSASAAAGVPVARKTVWHDAIPTGLLICALQTQLVAVLSAPLHCPSLVQSSHGPKHMVTVLQVVQTRVSAAQLGEVLASCGGAPPSDRSDGAPPSGSAERTSRSPSLSAAPQPRPATRGAPSPR